MTVIYCKSTPSFLDTALAGKCALCSTHVLASVPEHTPYTTNTLTISHTLYSCMQYTYALPELASQRITTEIY